jgi:ankyrin repeat protein
MIKMEETTISVPKKIKLEQEGSSVRIIIQWFNATRFVVVLFFLLPCLATIWYNLSVGEFQIQTRTSSSSTTINVGSDIILLFTDPASFLDRYDGMFQLVLAVNLLLYVLFFIYSLILILENKTVIKIDPSRITKKFKPFPWIGGLNLNFSEVKGLFGTIFDPSGKIPKHEAKKTLLCVKLNNGATKKLGNFNQDQMVFIQGQIKQIANVGEIAEEEASEASHAINKQMKAKIWILGVGICLIPMAAALIATNYKTTAEKFLSSARYGEIRKVEKMIADGVDINIRFPSYGHTALIEVSGHGNSKFVQYLVENGADISISSAEYCFYPSLSGTALMRAVMRGHINIVKYLISKGADIHKTVCGGNNTVYFAAYGKKFDVVTYLLSLGVNPNPGLIGASDSGSLEIIKLLLENGADINYASKSKPDLELTALMIAAAEGRLEIVKYLAENDANLNLKTKFGETALSLAEKNKNRDLVAYLKEKGADK